MKIVIPIFLFLFPVMAFTQAQSMLRLRGRVPAAVNLNYKVMAQKKLNSRGIEISLNVPDEKYEINKISHNKHQYFEIIFH